MGVLTKLNYTDELKARGFEGFSDTSLQRYIDWAYWHVARVARLGEELASQTIVLDPGEYKINFSELTLKVSGIRKLFVVTTDHERELEVADEDDFFEHWYALDLTTVGYRGEPSRYANVGNDLYIIPPPVASRSIRVDYWSAPTALTGSATSVLPDEFDEAILEAALYRCHVRAREPDEAAEARKRLDELFNDILIRQNMMMDEGDDRVKPWIRS